jgi:NAD(P)H-flavin reductase
MGWGPDPIWSSATVASNEAACASGKSCYIKIQVNAETYAQFQVPGQYVQLRLNEGMEKPLFLAMACAPGVPDENNSKGGTLEFLVKKTESNSWLTEIGAGAKVQMSQVLGNGYKVKENFDGYKYDFPTQNIVLCAAGSGIAPIKSALESTSWLMGDSGAISGSRTATLYYGERTEADLCFTDSFETWEQEYGVVVVPVLSQPTSEDDGHRTGYVQNALEEDGGKHAFDVCSPARAASVIYDCLALWTELRIVYASPWWLVPH